MPRELTRFQAKVPAALELAPSIRKFEAVPEDGRQKAANTKICSCVSRASGSIAIDSAYREA
jgi:hypothetical protein